MQVANLFGLSYADLLRDNQGVINSPNEPLAGRSILLCGRNGERCAFIVIGLFSKPKPARHVQLPDAIAIPLHDKHPSRLELGWSLASLYSIG